MSESVGDLDSYCQCLWSRGRLAVQCQVRQDQEALRVRHGRPCTVRVSGAGCRARGCEGLACAVGGWEADRHDEFDRICRPAGRLRTGRIPAAFVPSVPSAQRLPPSASHGLLHAPRAVDFKNPALNFRANHARPTLQDTRISLSQLSNT